MITRRRLLAMLAASPLGALLGWKATAMGVDPAEGPDRSSVSIYRRTVKIKENASPGVKYNKEWPLCSCGRKSTHGFAVAVFDQKATMENGKWIIRKPGKCLYACSECARTNRLERAFARLEREQERLVGKFHDWHYKTYGGVKHNASP